MKKRLLALLLSLPLALTVTAAEPAPPIDPVPEWLIGEVLVLGPLPLPKSALDEQPKAEQLRRALVMQISAGGLPRHDQSVSAFGRSWRWQRMAPSAQPAGEGLWLWALNLDTAAFTQGSLQLGGLIAPAVWREGVSQTVKDGKVELTLANGTHPMLFLHHGRAGGDAVALTWRGKTAGDRVLAGTAAQRRVSARLLSNAETVGGLAISADGRLAAMTFSSRNDSAGIDLRRVEVRALADQRVLHGWTAATPAAMAFSPDNRWLAWREGKQLWLRRLDDGRSRLLLAEHEHLGAFRWHPDSRSILFAWNTPFEAKDAKVKRLRALDDRWKTWRDISQLYQVDVESGLVRPLTRESSSVTLQDVHPDGDRLLLTQSLVDYTEPPYGLTRLFELSLASGETREVARLRQAGALRFAAEGYWLTAGPGFAEGAGTALAEGLTPNEYDGQLYRLAADGTLAESLSRGFDPAIGGIERLADGDLLLPVTEGDRAGLYRYDVRSRRFVALNTGVDQMEAFVVSTGRQPTVLLAGSDVAAPQRVHALDLARNRSRIVVDSLAGAYPQVQLGQVREFRVDNRHGEPIDGRYYLPPDFDPARTYPLIVFYYGGTTPVNRQFTGRYPLHLWAANGYVVYVPQPRGTIGYGQRYSALHVNAWGEHAADDIIDGTRAFIAAHPFVDGKRIGNIGASYGGFMTMYLATRTDLFAASVSHAGISALSAYWGQGWWGYSYSGIASRGSFPWNNRELYVDRSPLFAADRITTPLLLLTGDSDTNVPPGESHSMYTALTLLGREVELIEVPGEDHWILDREKRYVWWDSMLAWFDRWLKDQPQWWHSLYPETRPGPAAPAG